MHVSEVRINFWTWSSRVHSHLNYFQLITLHSHPSHFKEYCWDHFAVKRNSFINKLHMLDEFDENNIIWNKVLHHLNSQITLEYTAVWCIMIQTAASCCIHNYVFLKKLQFQKWNAWLQASSTRTLRHHARRFRTLFKTVAKFQRFCTVWLNKLLQQAVRKLETMFLKTNSVFLETRLMQINTKLAETKFWRKLCKPYQILKNNLLTQTLQT